MKPTLLNSSIRSFTLLDSQMQIIFSTVSLQHEFSAKIAAMPQIKSVLDASFAVDVQQWRTSERTCVFLVFLESTKSNTGQMSSFPIFALATAEPEMSYAELGFRCQFYFRVCQAIQQFGAPGQFVVKALTISPVYLNSLLRTAERRVDLNPGLYFGQAVFPPISQSLVSNSLVNGISIMTSVAQKIQESIEIRGISVKADQLGKIIEDTVVLLIVEDQVASCFSASGYYVIDPMDLLVLVTFQSDSAFMQGKIKQEACMAENSQSVFSKYKNQFDVDDQSDCAITIDSDGIQDCSRILFLRLRNKKIASVVLFRDINLHYSDKQLNARICYVIPITFPIAGELAKAQSNYDIIAFYKQVINLNIAPILETRITELSDHLLVNLGCIERRFMINSLVSQFPGLFQVIISNLSSGLTLFSDLSSMDFSQKQVVFKPVQKNHFASSTSVMFPHGLTHLALQNVKLTKVEDSQAVITEFLLRYESTRLYQFVISSMQSGISQAIERDSKFARVFFTFFCDANDLVSCQIFSQVFSNCLHLPLSRQQLLLLSQKEEILPNGYTEYLEQGGYVGSPQFYRSVDRLSRSQKQFQQAFSERPLQLVQLFQVSAVFIQFVDTQDIQSIVQSIFEKFASQLWSKLVQ